MSWKSCSANRLASHSADSTSASGVALPYLASSRLSSEPALTPIRIGVPWSFAAAAISLTWSSNLRMFPGFTRTAAQPASIAAKTYLGWKWMSAITGIWLLRAIAGSASASSWLGQATRTMSQPDAVSSAICCRVALTSAVRVVVIDCTEMGWSLPTPTRPPAAAGSSGAGRGSGAGGRGHAERNAHNTQYPRAPLPVRRDTRLTSVLAAPGRSGGSTSAAARWPAPPATRRPRARRPPPGRRPAPRRSCECGPAGAGCCA